MLIFDTGFDWFNDMQWSHLKNFGYPLRISNRSIRYPILSSCLNEHILVCCLSDTVFSSTIRNYVTNLSKYNEFTLTWKQLSEGIVSLGRESYFYFLNFFKDFFYSFERQRESERAQARGEAQGEGETDSPLSWEPDMGLDPRTWRSWPDPKVLSLGHLSHPGTLK